MAVLSVAKGWQSALPMFLAPLESLLTPVIDIVRRSSSNAEILVLPSPEPQRGPKLKRYIFTCTEAPAVNHLPGTL